MAAGKTNEGLRRALWITYRTWITASAASRGWRPERDQGADGPQEPNGANHLTFVLAKEAHERVFRIPDTLLRRDEESNNDGRHADDEAQERQPHAPPHDDQIAQRRVNDLFKHAAGRAHHEKAKKAAEAQGTPRLRAHGSLPWKKDPCTFFGSPFVKPKTGVGVF